MDWRHRAIATIEADFNRSADTHLIRVDLPKFNGITLYLKDESSHPTGSLKHRLARSLFLFAICNGKVGPHTTIVEASSGSTAVSEAYFARMLNLPFVAVMPRTTSPEKIAAIEFYGGRPHLVDDPKSVYDAARQVAEDTGGYYMDQFTYAERATDWRGNNNIADSIFSQMQREEHPNPRWIVTGAGTGGTSATLGRYIRYRALDTRLCVADPSGSIFHQHFMDRSVTEIPCCTSMIEGIGRPRVEPSFIPEVVDCMVAVPDAASLAAQRVIGEILGRTCGGSTGTNIWACAHLISDMIRRGETGSVVTLLCDHGDRYRSTYLNDSWIKDNSFDIEPHLQKLRAFFHQGQLMPE
ncbi:MAG: PLP-dependent cysteine synthase family protein [Brucellaceae bacterium]|nr:PLP-dependent cysteine synthase family protein [Brucellaceae bacterium]